MTPFKSDSEKRTSAAQAGPDPQAEASLSIIAQGLEVVGDLETAGVVKIEGKVRGTVRAGRQIVVGAGGIVEGDLITREAIIGGKVAGSVQADERVEIQAPSLVNGDITTKRIVIAEGGQVNGAIHMSDQGSALPRREANASPGPKLATS